ncbi:MAG TPA: hypothetical protein DD477_03020 [Spirochaetaceae bacterium]|nr:hypothetical protein [Spirochaetaceae bacterium]HAW86168.1 hypothetical protein [Spirochaetaceae bacterium]HAX38471.1 hypothetical protein [Spirochaetaceae bacterium]HBO40172.1 hypothetical protein [Spirochaetaceae bacterium]HCQ87202.1 hypothetical protein [Spirochaetaceae bacterium]
MEVTGVGSQFAPSANIMIHSMRLRAPARWSRRIDHEHRVICKVQKDHIIFIAFRFHYAK